MRKSWGDARVLAVLSALAEPTRLAAMRILDDRDEQRVCDLMRRLDATQSRMSRHMQVLKQAGPSWWTGRMRNGCATEGGELQNLLDHYPTLAPLGGWIDQHLDLPSMMATVATWLSNTGAMFVRGSLLQAAEVLITFYLLFYFLRDRAAAVTLIKTWLPLAPDDAEYLLRRVVDTVHATVYGTLAVATIQGTLGELMFWTLGMPAPLLWGLVMGLLSIVPVLGSFVVWIPAALLLLLDGSWIRAFVLAAWGGIVVGGIDNVLRPTFVGNRLRLHTILAFISIIGGLILFGAPGFILGPMAATMTMLLVEVWTRQAALSEAPK